MRPNGPPGRRGRVRRLARAPRSGQLAGATQRAAAGGVHLWPGRRGPPAYRRLDRARRAELRRRCPNAPAGATYFQAGRCDECGQTGRQGDVAVFDVWRARHEAASWLEQPSVLPLEEYICGLAAEGHLPIDDETAPAAPSCAAAVPTRRPAPRTFRPAAAMNAAKRAARATWPCSTSGARATKRPVGWSNPACCRWRSTSVAWPPRATCLSTTRPRPPRRVAPPLSQRAGRRHVLSGRPLR